MGLRRSAAGEMTGRALFDEFEQLVGLGSRYRAARLACEVLAVLIRHLPESDAAMLEEYLPRRVALAARRSGAPGRYRPQLTELLQEIAVSTDTWDPRDAVVLLQAALASLEDVLPVAVADALRADLPAVADRGERTTCRLCAPMPWPPPVSEGRHRDS